MLFRLIPVIFALGALCFADTITLKNGTTVQGSYIGGDARSVRIAVGDRIDTYSIDELSSIRFSGNSDGNYTRGPEGSDRRSDNPPPPPPPVDRGQGYERAPQPGDRAPQSYDRPPQPGDRGPQSYDRPPQPGERGPQGFDRTPPSSGYGLIPAGTSLVVRMIDRVDSETDHMGQTYRASIDEPVVVDGETVIPRGADVIAKLVDDKQSGKFEGRTVLTLDLMQVQVNGRMVDVNTTDVSQQSGSRGARTGKVVGGTAALGAIIGAIAGGGRGAAIGAASGAGVGAGAEIMTKGQRVRIPSEARLTFTLQQPLQP